jgi:multiple sugar transport system substrate-binding protein
MAVAPTIAAAKDIDIWTRNPGAGIITGLSEVWNAANPDDQVNVTVIPNGQFVTKFTLAVASGSVPDVVSIDLVYTPAFMEQGVLEDLTDAVAQMPFAAHLSPAHTRLATWTDGRQYALPFSAEGSVLVYNKGLFAWAGLDPENPPKTW